MSTANKVTGTASRTSRRSSFLSMLLRQREFGITIFVLLVFMGFSLALPNFATKFNLLNMGRQMSELVVLGAAMTLLLIAQELDLSVGSIYGLISFSLGLLAQNLGLNIWLSMAIVMALAAFIGFVNGVITVYGGIPSFITTLGMMGVLRGITLWLSPWPVNRLEAPLFFEIFGGRVDIFGWNVPLQMIWMILIVILGVLLLTRTTLGYQIRATGSNRVAAELAGIPVKRVKIIAFVITAMAAGLAGIFGFAHVNSVAPTAGTGLELTVIAAVVIGGTALFGGEGSVFGTFLGAALLTILRNGLIQMGSDGRLIDTYIGIIIVAAVLIHTHIGHGRR